MGTHNPDRIPGYIIRGATAVFVGGHESPRRPQPTFTAPDGSQVEYTEEALRNIESGVCLRHHEFQRACSGCFAERLSK